MSYKQSNNEDLCPTIEKRIGKIKQYGIKYNNHDNDSSEDWGPTINFETLNRVRKIRKIKQYGIKYNNYDNDSIEDWGPTIDFETRKKYNIKQSNIKYTNNYDNDSIEDWGPTIDFETRKKYNIKQSGIKYTNNYDNDSIEDWGPTIDFDKRPECNIKQSDKYGKYRTSTFYTQSNLKDCDKAILPEGLSYEEIDKSLLEL
jgi:hypothetical protein